jgi:hypothetical protein
LLFAVVSILEPMGRKAKALADSIMWGLTPNPGHQGPSGSGSRGSWAHLLNGEPCEAQRMEWKLFRQCPTWWELKNSFTTRTSADGLPRYFDLWHFYPDLIWQAESSQNRSEAW